MFPELYEDFNRGVPVPNYTRRDGVLNVASHFPSNTVAPDLGMLRSVSAWDDMLTPSVDF